MDDLTWLADLGAKQDPPVKISYEPWCFGPHRPDWELCWEAVQASVSCPLCEMIGMPMVIDNASNSQGHPNLGLCLDTAHVALSPHYGYNPLTGEGYGEEAFQAALERIRQIPAEKLHYYEISDVLKPEPALLQGSRFDAYHQKEIDQGTARPIFTWTICGRSLPLVGRGAGEMVESELDMGAARCVEVTKAVFQTGFRGKYRL